ncbi:hypothetical protein ACFC0X_12725 [Paenibacillus chitinolyticus]|uniref:hypothetical protein n=1 Tax=Paenibacillus chitinolyticus TaxID=79263 RepID=UPI0035E03FA8
MCSAIKMKEAVPEDIEDDKGWLVLANKFAVTYGTVQLNGGIGEKFAATLNR